MVMLCFVLDLGSLPSSMCLDLKQSLLQLANLYAISTPVAGRLHSNLKLLHDRLGLCYVLKNKISLENELKVAYSPRGNFRLRDFHHAVNNFPTNAFLPLSNSGEALGGDGDLIFGDLKLSAILSDEVLYSWEVHEKDIAKKVILISSRIAKALDSETRKTLMDAADRCVSVEFVLFKQETNHLGEISESISNFMKQIGDLENFSFRAYFPDTRALFRLVKQWLQDLNSMENQLQARLIFKDNLSSSLSCVSCNLCKSIDHVIDGFDPCQTCRCHGVPLNSTNLHNIKKSFFCSITGEDIRSVDIIDNSLRIGECSILFMPSFYRCVNLKQVSSMVEFSIVERTNLGTLSEGLIFGTSYFITPSACHESDDIDKAELNIQFFRGLCAVLHSLDQGLICSSNCNIETLRETSFPCYYIILPSDKDIMLLRRLAGLEEVFPFPEFSQFGESIVPKEIENTIQDSLLKIKASDYNPFLHARGIHQKLNLLVKESLQSGTVHTKLRADPNSMEQDSSEVLPFLQAAGVARVGEKLPQLNQKKVAPSHMTQLSTQLTDHVSTKEQMLPLNEDDKEDKTTASITEEWEQLIVTEVPKKQSPTCISKLQLDQPVSLATHISRLDDKTSRILERLEIPRRSKAKISSPIIPSSSTTDASVSTKKPLIPFEPIDAVGQGKSASQAVKLSQPLKPNFQRLKRKLR